MLKLLLLQGIPPPSVRSIKFIFHPGHTRFMSIKTQENTRCGWCSQEKEGEMTRYHDEEWGVPVRDDKKLFEFLILEGAQAGLSWATILKKRQNYLNAFADFDIAKVAAMDQAAQDALMLDPGIVRNRLKIKATVANAKAALEIQKEFGSLSTYLWSFIPDTKPIQPARKSGASLQDTWPTTSPESDAMSKALKKRGMTFIGSTILYAFMQAVGMVNDHTTDCFRYSALKGDPATSVSKKKGVPVESLEPEATKKATKKRAKKEKNQEEEEDEERPKKRTKRGSAEKK